MEELFEVILAMILEIFGEAILEIFMGALADVLSRFLRRFFVVSRWMGPIVSGVVFALLGCGAGLFSLAAFPHPVFGGRTFHGASLLISPIAAGLGMSLVGWMVRVRGGRRARIETFRYGFLFALAMAIVRFALVDRP